MDVLILFNLGTNQRFDYDNVKSLKLEVGRLMLGLKVNEK